MMKYKQFFSHILHLATCLLLLAAVAVNKNGKLAGYEFGAAAQPAAEAVVAATSSGDTTATLITTFSSAMVLFTTQTHWPSCSSEEAGRRISEVLGLSLLISTLV